MNKIRLLYQMITIMLVTLIVLGTCIVLYFINTIVLGAYIVSLIVFIITLIVGHNKIKHEHDEHK